MNAQHPGEYPSYGDIPESEKKDYQQVPGGGFTHADAVENTLEAVEEAQVEDNLHELGGLMQKRGRDIQGWLEALRNTQMPPSLTADDRSQIEREFGIALPESMPGAVPERKRVTDALASLREKHEDRRQKLETHRAALQRIIRQHRITDAIDQEFIEDVIFYVNLWEEPSAPAERSDDDAQHERQFLEEALSRLRQRAAKRNYERSGETVTELRTSGDRSMNIRVSEKGDQVRMEFSPFVDFNREKVQLGPNAVEKILGGRFTAQDYEIIANALLTIEGPAGIVCRRYAEACHAWAIAYTQKSPDERETRFQRREATWKLIDAFGGKDPSVAPLADIPLNAIFYTVKQRFPELASTEVPQPFVE